MTKINKSDLVECHSLTKYDAKTKENSATKIEKQPLVKSSVNKSFVPNPKLTKKLNENTQDLYLTTDIAKTYNTAKNSPQKTNCFRNKSFVSNKIINSSFHKSILIKEENKKDMIETFISELEQFNNNFVKIQNSQFINFNKIFQIFETLNSLDETKKVTYTQIWKKFLSNIEKIFKMNSNSETLKQDRFGNRSKEPIKPKQTINAYNNISHLNNNNFNFQIVEASNLECEKLKKSLTEKDKALRELKSLLDNKEEKLKEFEKNQLTSMKDTSSLKNNYVTSNLEMRNLDNVDLDQEELEMYQNKQLMRDFKNLSSENKNLREVITNLEKDMKTSKEKELKIMHILYSLKKKGVMVESLISEEFPKELTDMSKNLLASRKLSENSETSRSLDNSMYTPICIDSPCYFKKPEKIPYLNLDNINSLYNRDYLSPTNLKDKKNIFGGEKNEENVKKEKEIVKELGFNKNMFNSTKISRDKAKRSEVINATVDVSSNLYNSPSIQFQTLNENKSNLSSNKIKISSIHNPRISLHMNLKDKISFKERIKNILQKK